MPEIEASCELLQSQCQWLSMDGDSFPVIQLIECHRQPQRHSAFFCSRMSTFKPSSLPRRGALTLCELIAISKGRKTWSYPEKSLLLSINCGLIWLVRHDNRIQVGWCEVIRFQPRPWLTEVVCRAINLVRNREERAILGHLIRTFVQKYQKPSVQFSDKPFICEHSNCQKRFANKFLLKKHQFIHTGLRPHTCPFCNKR